MTRGRNNPDGRIRKKVWIKASADVVYRALTESKELERWFCDQASCTPREGGELIACWRNGKLRRKGRAVFTRLVPESEMELLWVDDGGDHPEQDLRHTLKYEIRSSSEMTELIVTDAVNLPTDEETYSFLDQGWNSVLLELKDHCEQKERASHARAKKTAR
ncbi:MAG TPA: SRPBCC domain-containing protein [Acidobacteriota bacterium]|nr:SRPBCC domain-containing protein [Acidobacteriota bacterium]